jgi:hypothetical protein
MANIPFLPLKVSNLYETVHIDAKRDREEEPIPIPTPTPRLSKILLAIGEADDDLTYPTWYGVVELYSVLTNATEDELETLFTYINKRGLKVLMHWFLTTRPEFASRVIYRNADSKWWLRRYDLPSGGLLNLKEEEDGYVVVDLWHARRGKVGPTSFTEFKSAYPTFFMGSYGLLSTNSDSIEDYIEEDESGDLAERAIYVKRGRFRFKPLLWFSDKSVAALRNKASKAEVVAKLLNSHPKVVELNMDFSTETDAAWRKALYYKPTTINGYKLGNELRLDNNCVDEAAIPLAAGYQGTLAVDVSGFAGATQPPGSATPETKSVVIWDVPNSLLEEGPWEELR